MKILNILQMPWKYSPVEEVDSVNKGKENNLYILRDTQAKKKKSCYPCCLPQKWYLLAYFLIISHFGNLTDKPLSLPSMH